MTRYQSAMTSLSTALAKARAPSANHTIERQATSIHAQPKVPISPQSAERRAATHKSSSLLVRFWLAISSWAARRDSNSHQ
jgi:hypothetical protein